MDAITVVIILFVLSLLGASVLFKFLVSSALVTGKRYQAGGAIAGFLLLYWTLLFSHGKINDCQECNDARKRCEQELQVQSIKGEIEGYDGEQLKMILAVRQTEPDSRGKYMLKAPGLDPENGDVKVVVLSPSGTKIFSIFTKEELDDFSIDIKDVN